MWRSRSWLGHLLPVPLHGGARCSWRPSSASCSSGTSPVFAPEEPAISEPFLGVVTDAPVPTVRGVLLGSPAAAAGLRAGDLLLEVGGHPLRTAVDLQTGLRHYRPGDEVTVRLARDRQLLDLKLVLVANDRKH